MHPLIRLASGALLLAPLAAAVAQTTPTQPVQVTPYDPYLGEHVGIRAWNGQCPQPFIDVEQAPELRQLSHTAGAGGPQQDEYTYELVYRMRLPDLCFSAPAPASFGAIIDLGDALPEGHHHVDVKGMAPDDTVFVAYDVDFHIGPADDLRGDVSGIWYAPEQNGRGVTVALRGDTGVVYWATHDDEGDPAWNVLTVPRNTMDERNVLEGTSHTTRGAPLAPGDAALALEDWGHVRFEYQRCGAATLTWDALDPAVEDGSLDLVQILQPDGVYVCDVANQPDRVEAVRVEVPTP